MTASEAGGRLGARYEIHGEIAAGGMARVHYGRQRGDQGFTRVVAIKRMLPRFAENPRSVAMFLDEAMLASRIRHPNVVATLDVVDEAGEALIVMEYVRGLPLSTLLSRASARGERVSVEIAASVMIGALSGLHAAHEARGADGVALEIVHRDVSPHNVLVDVDGVARVMDFGIAKAQKQSHVTLEGEVKGKMGYMSPEQLLSAPVDRRADVFSAGVVAWVMLGGRRLFVGENVEETASQVLTKEVPSLSELRDDVSPELDRTVRRALTRERTGRYESARDFQGAIEAAVPRVATSREVGTWVERLGGDILAARDAEVQRVESGGVVAVAQPVIDDWPTATDAPTTELVRPGPDELDDSRR